MIIELTLLKEMILIKSVHQKSVKSVAIDAFQINDLNFNQMPAIEAMAY